VVLLNGPQGTFPPRMPTVVSLPVHQPAKTIHMLSGVSGWGAQSASQNGSVSMEVWIVYEDGGFESIPLYNGRHFADYIGRFDVPESQLAFRLRNSQIRYLSVQPSRNAPIDHISLVKGQDRTAPIVMAVTVEAVE
jgi:hypothetical protein